MPIFENRMKTCENTFFPKILENQISQRIQEKRAKIQQKILEKGIYLKMNKKGVIFFFYKYFKVKVLGTSSLVIQIFNLAIATKIENYGIDFIKFFIQWSYLSTYTIRVGNFDDFFYLFSKYAVFILKIGQFLTETRK